jgi:hypothetical protein
LYGCVLLLATLHLTEAIAQTVQELRIGWDAYIGVPAPHISAGEEKPANVFTLVGHRRVAGLIQRERNPQLSSDQIVVVAVDRQGRDIDWQLVPDPRVLRAELPDITGELRGQVFHHVKTELLVSLPDNPAIVQIRLYHPRWTGNTFVLELLGTVSLP